MTARDTHLRVTRRTRCQLISLTPGRRKRTAKANHAALVAAKKRRLPDQQCSADVISASKADDAAEAEISMFELQPVQRTAAVSYAGLVETANEQLTLESHPNVSHAAVRTVGVLRAKQGRDSRMC